MDKKQTIEAVAERAGTTQANAQTVLDAFCKTLADTLAAGSEVRFTGLGTFSVKDKPEREGRNPRTGEPVRIAASRQPQFKAGKPLRDQVNKPVA